MKSILFVCLHNACRSRIAEAIAGKIAPPTWLIASAGADPSAGVDPKAELLLKSKGLRMSEGQPRGLDQLPQMEWDCVVAMGCGDPRSLARAKSAVEWLVPDPDDGPREVYEELYADLAGRVARLLGRVAGE